MPYTIYINKKGDKQFLCLRPLLGYMRPLGSLYTITWQVTNVTQHIRRLAHLSVKPIFNISASIKLDSTMS